MTWRRCGRNYLGLTGPPWMPICFLFNAKGVQSSCYQLVITRPSSRSQRIVTVKREGCLPSTSLDFHYFLRAER
ncbi:hypothetical protein CC2G_006064 [Coprinopsis cinerea AmutBmut pab1-1]|nr:hypothetical protein CC2G_006064 [Coprinopsis cinerea AmutBmut pab1-1]